MRLSPQISSRHTACATLTLDDFRFEELRVQIDPQSGANSVIISVDRATSAIDRAATVDMGGVKLIIAGRPEPPPARGCATCCFIAITCICPLCLCISRWCTFSCFVTIKILFNFVDAEQKYFIGCGVSGIRVIFGILIG